MCVKTKKNVLLSGKNSYFSEVVAKWRLRPLLYRCA